VTRNTNIGPNGNNYWNENNVKILTTNNWRASLVPAAAVIPAPRVYIKVVAVKKLVVGFKFHESSDFLLNLKEFNKYF